MSGYISRIDSNVVDLIKCSIMTNMRTRGGELVETCVYFDTVNVHIRIEKQLNSIIRSDEHVPISCCEILNLIRE